MGFGGLDMALRFPALSGVSKRKLRVRIETQLVVKELI